jgi:hypothetical protein
MSNNNDSTYLETDKETDKETDNETDNEELNYYFDLQYEETDIKQLDSYIKYITSVKDIEFEVIEFEDIYRSFLNKISTKLSNSINKIKIDEDDIAIKSRFLSFLKKIKKKIENINNKNFEIEGGSKKKLKAKKVFDKSNKSYNECKKEHSKLYEKIKKSQKKLLELEKKCIEVKKKYIQIKKK